MCHSEVFWLGISLTFQFSYPPSQLSQAYINYVSLIVNYNNVWLLHVLLILNCYFFSTLNYSSSAQFISCTFLPILCLSHWHAACFYHWVCFYMCLIHAYLCSYVWSYIYAFCNHNKNIWGCVYICVWLVLWPHSISQYRTSLSSVPSGSVCSGPGTIIYDDILYVGARVLSILMDKCVYVCILVSNCSSVWFGWWICFTSLLFLSFLDIALSVDAYC